MSIAAPTKEDLMQEQILRAAKQLFQVHGLAKVTMDDVARAIGKGRSSLYYYYKSKDEIFDAVVDIELREMFSAIAKAVNQAKTSEEKLQAFCVAKLQVLRDKRAFFKPLDAGMDADTFSHFRKTQVAHHNIIIKQEGILLRALLENGIKNAELHAINDKELELMIYVVLSSLHGIKREMAIEDSFDKIEPVVSAFTRMVMQGLKK